MNPIISILFNIALGTYHPIVFIESPLPGPYSPDKPTRHRSKMHHTSGFPTRDEAIKNIETDLKDRVAAHFGQPKLALARDIPWDGDGIPVMTAMFVENNGVLVNALDGVSMSIGS